MGTIRRVRIYSGLPAGEASMPMCGVCRKRIGETESYAGVLYEGGLDDNDGLREVRHNPGCVEWRATQSKEIQEGDILTTIRFYSDERGQYPVVVTGLDSSDVNEFGWRAVWGRDAENENAEPVKAYQSTEELVHIIRH